MSEEKQKIKEALPPLTKEESAALDRTVGTQERDNVAVLKAQKRVRIIIPSGRDPHEQCPVSVGVNGHNYLIKRDAEVDVPEAVLHALQLAVEQTPVVEGERVTGFRTVQRYPAQLLDWA